MISVDPSCSAVCSILIDVVLHIGSLRSQIASRNRSQISCCSNLLSSNISFGSSWFEYQFIKRGLIKIVKLILNKVRTILENLPQVVLELLAGHHCFKSPLNYFSTVRCCLRLYAASLRFDYSTQKLSFPLIICSTSLKHKKLLLTFEFKIMILRWLRSPQDSSY